MKQKKIVSMLGMLVVLIGTIFMMTGCPNSSGQNKPKAQNNVIIEGITWKMTKPIVPNSSITLMLRDGKAASTITATVAGMTSTKESEGTYKITGNKLELNLPYTSGILFGEYEYAVSGNTMKLSMNGVFAYEFEKQ